MGITKIRCLLGVEVFEISDKYIMELRQAHRNAEEVFDILPEYTINTNKGVGNKPVLAKYFHQFIGHGDSDEKYLYFNLQAADNQLDFEIREGSIEDIFEGYDFKELLSHFKPQTDDDIKKYVFPQTNFLVVELTYITSQDYYSGGWETDVEVEIIGYLNPNLEIQYFKTD